jgi:hypothetical protein
MITAEEKLPSSILPVKEHTESISVEDIEKGVLNLLSKKNYKLVETYNMYKGRNANALLKDIVMTLEELLKAKMLEDEKKQYTANLIFGTIKSQIKILENLNEEILKSEVVEQITVALLSTTLLYFKKFFA